MSTTPWQWDPNRREYYLWSEAEQAWVYQSGTRVRRETPSTPDSVPRGQAGLERRISAGGYSIPESSLSAGSGTSGSYTHVTDQLSALQLGDSSAHQLSSSAPASYYSAGAQIQAYAAPTQYAESSQHAYGQELIAPSQLQKYQSGTYLYAKIAGTPGDEERLDPRFKVRRPGKAFFKIGRVFKVLWAEPAGNSNTSVSEIVCHTQFRGERLIAKIRWFVVVLPGQDNQCQCFGPINTYGNQGVAKRGVVKHHHAIIHNHNRRPFMTENERPGPGELGMISPIRVKGRSPSDKMHKMSRINFGRTYTVEHNVKAFHFGEVHKDDLADLYNQWRSVVNSEIDRALQGYMNSVIEEDPEEDEEEYDDGEEQEGDEEDEEDEEDDDG